jgi:hypothetical protein
VFQIFQSCSTALSFFRRLLLQATFKCSARVRPCPHSSTAPGSGPLAAGLGLVAAALVPGQPVTDSMGLSDDLASATFALKDDLLTAMAGVSPSVKTVADLRAYDGCRLTTTPPAAASVTSLLSACTAIRGTVKDDVAGRTALGHVLALLEASAGSGSSSSTSTSTAAADAAFALKAYNELGRRMISRVNAEDKVEGKLVRKAHDDLDRGTLSRECFVLTGLRALNAGTEERHVSVGGVRMMSESEAQVALARNGDVLLQIFRNLKMLLAAGFRVITPAPETPSAGSAGDSGSIKYKRPGAADETVRYHLTPEGADLHMLAALRGSCALTPLQLAGAHATIFELAVNKMQKLNLNLESALVKTHESKTFVQAAADAAPTAGATAAAPAPPAAPDRVRELEKQVKAHENTIAQLKRGRGDGGTAQGGTPSGPLAVKKGSAGDHCFDFARTGKCPRGDKCPFSHQCMVCGSTEHGTMLCPDSKV